MCVWGECPTKITMSVIEEDRYQIIEPVKCCRCCVHGRSSVEQRRRSQEANQSVRLSVVMQLFDENNFLHIDREPTTTTTLIDLWADTTPVNYIGLRSSADHQWMQQQKQQQQQPKVQPRIWSIACIHKYKKCVIWSVINRKSIVGFGIKLRFILSIREKEVMIWYNSDSI